MADGTPQALCAALPGRVWRLRNENARRLEVKLRAQAGVLGVAQIGTDLRVLAEPTVDEAALRAWVDEANVEIESVAPNLEDVFVAATRQARLREAA